MRVKREKAVKAPPDKPVAKESASKEEKDEPVAKGNGAPESNTQSPSEQWSDWIWSEERNLYYRAKKSSPETWKYEFAEPPSELSISLSEPQTPRYISPKVAYQKTEEKVIYVKESTYEVPGTAGGSYVLTRCEKMEVGGKAEAESASKEPGAVEGGQTAASKNAGAVDGRQEERNKADPAENEKGGEKEEAEKERDMKQKKKEKHGEKKDSRHKVRRK